MTDDEWISSASSFAEVLERLEQIATTPGYDTKKLLADQSERHQGTEAAMLEASCS